MSQQDEKSQIRNKEKGLKILRSRIYELERKKKEEERSKDRKSKIGTGDRSERIRTYNWPQNRVTDHRINLTINKLTEFMEGQISIDENGQLIKGKLGKELKTDDGYKAATRCALNITAQAKKACYNDLSKIKSCIKLTGFVNSSDDFIEQAKVINGASDTIVKIFGEAGMHTRAAVSTNSLPLGVAVEVDAIFELN